MAEIEIKLTKRQRQVAEFIQRGLASADMANELKISVRTVDLHRFRLMKKLGARNVAHLSAVLNENLINQLRNQIKFLEAKIIILERLTSN